VSAHLQALAELRGFDAPTAEQAGLRDDYLQHLEEHPDGLLRSCVPDHLTSGAVVLSPGLDSVLLNLHRKAGRWFHFGGHLEPGDESLWDAAQRETAEESGLRALVVPRGPVHLSRHTVPFCAPPRRVDHLDVRFAAVGRPGSEHASEESLDVRWWPLNALPDLEPEMHELIALARERLAQSTPGSSSAASSSVGSHRAPAE
jgi:8-oxo-dGTP pyrophosphatase MutT (NUDIX family)